MNKTFTLMALCLFTLCAKAQTDPSAAMPTDAPYGKVDNADLTNAQLQGVLIA